jgi:hypothetical protein
MIPHCIRTGQALRDNVSRACGSGDEEVNEACRAGELVFYSGSLRLTLAWRVKSNEEKAPHDDHYGVSAVC